MSKEHFPEGWDESRVQRVLDHYEALSDEEAVAEDEAAFDSPTHTTRRSKCRLISFLEFGN